MTNPYYNPTGVPATRATLSSSTQRIEFAAIGTAFDKLAPTLTANGLLHVNAAGTAYAASTVITVSAAGAIAGITDLTTTGNTALGNAVGDTLSVSGVAIKNATGNWSIPAPSSGNAWTVLGISGARALILDTSSAAVASGLDFKRNSVAAAVIANAGSTNDFVTGSAQGDLVYRTESGAHRFVTAAGGRIPVVIADAGNVTIAAPSSGSALTLPMAASGLIGLTISAGAGQPAAVQLAGNATSAGTTSFDVFQNSASVAVLQQRANAAMNFSTNNILRMVIAAAGNVTIAAPSSGYALNLPLQTPASATAAGTAGDVAVDANFFYACTATNTWKRVALATW